MNYIEIDVAESNTTLDAPEEELIKKSINKVAEIEKLPFDIFVSVLLVDKDQMQEINKEQRNVDKVTDVLSFPGLEFNEEYQLVEQITDADYDPEFHAVYLGDIVICNDVVKEQAKEYGHSKERELAYLTVHSMYHLLGYDHINDSLKTDMRKKEEEALLQI